MFTYFNWITNLGNMWQLMEVTEASISVFVALQYFRNTSGLKLIQILSCRCVAFTELQVMALSPALQPHSHHRQSPQLQVLPSFKTHHWHNPPWQHPGFLFPVALCSRRSFQWWLSSLALPKLRWWQTDADPEGSCTDIAHKATVLLSYALRRQQPSLELSKEMPLQ